MAVIRAQVNIPRDTALPEDVSINTWHFEIDDATVVGNIDPIQAALAAFYGAIDQFLSVNNANPVVVKWYNLADPQPRPPIRLDSMTLTFDTTTTSLMPEEAAICLSYRAAAQAGAAAARRRGRIYLGPLGSGLGVTLAGRVQIAGAHLTTIAGAGAALKAASDAAATWKWCVYSPTTHAANPGDPGIAAFPVAAGWVDNAFDTQRRRGPGATSRTLF